MADIKYDELAKKLVELVGGPDNISRVTNCLTRLRFTLKDMDAPDDEAVKALSGVKGLVKKGGEYQVIIGTTVPIAAKAVKAVVGKKADDEDAAPAAVPAGNPLERVTKVLSDCIIPFIGPLIAGGILKGLLTILSTTGLMASSDGLYQILYAASDVVFYFMPVVVGFSSAKVFGCNQYVGAMIGAALLYPKLVAAVADPGLSVFGMPVSQYTYGSTLFPALLAVWVAAKVQKVAERVIPDILHMMIVPVFVLMISVPLAWLVIGPVASAVCSALSSAVMWLFGTSPVVAGFLLGALWQVAVAFGFSHGVLLPVVMADLTAQGSCPVWAVANVTMWALIGMALGYAAKVKSADQRAYALSGAVTVLCGVSEPLIYTVALPRVKVFAAACVGGGVGGAISAALNSKVYAITSGGIFSLPAYVGPDGVGMDLYVALLVAVVAIVVSGAIAFAVTERE